MDIMDLEPSEALKLATHRYTEQLRTLHCFVKKDWHPGAKLLEELEKAQQVEEACRERVSRDAETAMKACGLAPDEDQLALLLEPGT